MWARTQLGWITDGTLLPLSGIVAVRERAGMIVSKAEYL